MNKQLTDWFPPEQKPVRVGVYEIEGVPFPFHYWSKKGWLHIAGGSPSDLTRHKRKGCGLFEEGYYPSRQKWRGLASDPSQNKEGK